MKRTALVAFIAAAAVAQEKQMTTFNFDSDTAGEPPKGFDFALTGKGKPGKWVVQAVGDAPSGKNVLAQTDGDTTDYRFPIAYTGPELKDLRLSVKCKPIAGKGDQGCGIIWRLKDKDNYYITRANALEDNVHLYHVVKGRRDRFAGWNGKGTATPRVVDVLEGTFAQQRAFIEDPAKLKWALCTRRAAKSYSDGLALAKAALERPDVSSLYIGLTRESAKRIMWKDVLKAINRRHKLGVQFNETELSAKFPTAP